MNTDKLTFESRVWILVGMFAVTVIGMLFVPPIPQDTTYHLFADTRGCFGLPNFGDVSSNLGFAIVGILALWTLLGPNKIHFESSLEAHAYIIFFIGVGLVSVGSAYYHAAPDNARLFWDRLPMTVAFMALFAAILADRVQKDISLKVLLPILIVLGIASLVYWDYSETLDRGDLRPYGLVQFYPVAALPVICWLFPKSKYTGGGYLVWVVFWYGLAKMLEHFDAEVFDLLQGTVSGHSLKHMASAVATYMVLRMIVAVDKREITQAA